VLTVENLRKVYNKSNDPALKDISFRVDQGEFVAVLGLSGAGKSTLIRCINRLIDPTEGNIEWHGESIIKLKGKALHTYRRSIGMIFQSFNLVDRLNTLTNVLIGNLGYMSLLRAGLFYFNDAEKMAAYEALERVGLEQFSMRRVSQLSGGQRQRVAIARALVQKPQLILGDEPVASLDPQTSISVMELLKEINKQDQITMLINLHDVELAKRYATRIIGISDGNIVFDGSPKELTERDLSKIYSYYGSEQNELKSPQSVC
jgi:phosphonate transport system ATP-binding protein